MHIDITKLNLRIIQKCFIEWWPVSGESSRTAEEYLMEFQSTFWFLCVPLSPCLCSRLWPFDRVLSLLSNPLKARLGNHPDTKSDKAVTHTGRYKTYDYLKKKKVLSWEAKMQQSRSMGKKIKYKMNWKREQAGWSGIKARQRDPPPSSSYAWRPKCLADNVYIRQSENNGL